MTVGHYTTMSTFYNSIGVRPEPRAARMPAAAKSAASR